MRLFTFHIDHRKGRIGLAKSEVGAAEGVPYSVDGARKRIKPYAKLNFPFVPPTNNGRGRHKQTDEQLFIEFVHFPEFTDNFRVADFQRQFRKYKHRDDGGEEKQYAFRFVGIWSIPAVNDMLKLLGKTEKDLNGCSKEKRMEIIVSILSFDPDAEPLPNAAKQGATNAVVDEPSDASEDELALSSEEAKDEEEQDDDASFNNGAAGGDNNGLQQPRQRVTVCEDLEIASPPLRRSRGQQNSPQRSPQTFGSPGQHPRRRSRLNTPENAEQKQEQQPEAGNASNNDAEAGGFLKAAGASDDDDGAGGFILNEEAKEIKTEDIDWGGGGGEFGSEDQDENPSDGNIDRNAATAVPKNVVEERKGDGMTKGGDARNKPEEGLILEQQDQNPEASGGAASQRRANGENYDGDDEDGGDKKDDSSDEDDSFDGRNNGLVYLRPPLAEAPEHPTAPCAAASKKPFKDYSSDEDESSDGRNQGLSSLFAAASTKPSGRKQGSSLDMSLSPYRGPPKPTGELRQTLGGAPPRKSATGTLRAAIQSRGDGLENAHPNVPSGLGTKRSNPTSSDKEDEPHRQKRVDSRTTPPGKNIVNECQHGNSNVPAATTYTEPPASPVRTLPQAQDTGPNSNSNGINEETTTIQKGGGHSILANNERKDAPVSAAASTSEGVKEGSNNTQLHINDHSNVNGGYHMANENNLKRPESLIGEDSLFPKNPAQTLKQNRQVKRDSLPSHDLRMIASTNQQTSVLSGTAEAAEAATESNTADASKDNTANFMKDSDIRPVRSNDPSVAAAESDISTGVLVGTAAPGGSCEDNAKASGKGRGAKGPLLVETDRRKLFRCSFCGFSIAAIVGFGFLVGSCYLLGQTKTLSNADATAGGNSMNANPGSGGGGQDPLEDIDYGSFEFECDLEEDDCLDDGEGNDGVEDIGRKLGSGSPRGGTVKQDKDAAEVRQGQLNRQLTINTKLIGLFYPLDCNTVVGNELSTKPCLVSAGGSSFAAAVASARPGAAVVLACNTCYEYDLSSGVNAIGGLVIQGKLYVPPNYVSALETPYIFVQGELGMNDTQQISMDNASMTIVLTVTAPETFAPANSNVNMFRKYKDSRKAYEDSLKAMVVLPEQGGNAPPPMYNVDYVSYHVLRTSLAATLGGNVPPPVYNIDYVSYHVLRTSLASILPKAMAIYRPTIMWEKYIAYDEWVFCRASTMSLAAALYFEWLASAIDSMSTVSAYPPSSVWDKCAAYKDSLKGVVLPPGGFILHRVHNANCMNNCSLTMMVIAAALIIICGLAWVISSDSLLDVQTLYYLEHGAPMMHVFGIVHGRNFAMMHVFGIVHGRNFEHGSMVLALGAPHYGQRVRAAGLRDWIVHCTPIREWISTVVSNLTTTAAVTYEVQGWILEAIDARDMQVIERAIFVQTRVAFISPPMPRRGVVLMGDVAFIGPLAPRRVIGLGEDFNALVPLHDHNIIFGMAFWIQVLLSMGSRQYNTFMLPTWRRR